MIRIQPIAWHVRMKGNSEPIRFDYIFIITNPCSKNQ